MALPDADAAQTEPTPEEPHRRIFLSMVRDLNLHIDHILRERTMTRRDLARLLGKHDAEVSRWFNGKHNLTLETIAKMAAVLGEDLLVSPYHPPTSQPERSLPTPRSAASTESTGRKSARSGRKRPLRRLTDEEFLEEGERVG